MPVSKTTITKPAAPKPTTTAPTTKTTTKAPKAAPPPQLLVIECLAPDQLHPVEGTSDYTATVGARPGLLRQDGTPAQDGDVLSIQEDGSQQARAAGTNGNFERCRKTAIGAVYRPVGTRTFTIPLAPETPN